MLYTKHKKKKAIPLSKKPFYMYIIQQLCNIKIRALRFLCMQGFVQSSKLCSLKCRALLCTACVLSFFFFFFSPFIPFHFSLWSICYLLEKEVGILLQSCPFGHVLPSLKFCACDHQDLQSLRWLTLLHKNMLGYQPCNDNLDCQF